MDWQTNPNLPVSVLADNATLSKAYVFLLGLASGIAVLAISAYRRISPAWLRSLLIISGILLIGRYVVMALFTNVNAPERWWFFHRLWLASTISLILPTAFAIDQLIQHPGMTPKKLLLRLSPALGCYVIVFLFAKMSAVRIEGIGWWVGLTGPWRVFLGLVQTLVVGGLIAICVLLFKKISSYPMRRALIGLILAYAYLSVVPSLYSEMLVLLAVWHTFETAFDLQRNR